MDCPRVLLIGATPYNPCNQGRSLDSYFHFFPKECLHQIFSNSPTPVKGLCDELYQITDKRLAKARFEKANRSGKLFRYEDCVENNPKLTVTRKPPFLKGTGIFGLARKMVWRKKYWCTPELEKWVADFAPEIIFVYAGEDHFQYDIAEHFSKKLGIPIIVSIVDDIYFKNHFSLSPFWWIYKSGIRRKIRSFMKLDVVGSFCSDKIRDRYCDFFKIEGFTSYISTPGHENDADRPLPEKIENAYYFGNLEYGRWEALNDIAQAFLSKDSAVKVHVYTSNYALVENKKRPSNLLLHRPIPYDDVLSLTSNADLLLIAESNKPKFMKEVAYSLSTKVGDSFSFGRPLLCYAGSETGVASFLEDNDGAVLATNKKELQRAVSDIVDGKIDFACLRKKEKEIFDECFSLDKQAALFKQRVIAFLSERKK